MTDPAAEPLRVVIADDQTVVRDGLTIMLNLLPEIDVVGTAADGAEALALAEALAPDVMLLDLHMPVLDGVATTRKLSDQHPSIAVVVLTTYADDTSVHDALNAGALGYLTKNAGRDDIARALIGAANGQSVLDREVQATLLGSIQDSARHMPQHEQPLPDDLTPREAEVLALIAEGRSNSDIAALLYVSANTVKTHINRIFTKTGSRDRAQAILYAQHHGLAPRRRAHRM
jgi:DNA-binding NarL/FixJ family response regulator